MKNTRKTLVLILCLAATLLLSSCHVNNDPWYGKNNSQQDISATDGANPQPTEEGTQQPGGGEDPGLNG